MIEVLRKFFIFSGVRKKTFYLSILFGFLNSISTMLRMGAIYLVLDDILNHKNNSNIIWISFLIMFGSILLSMIFGFFSSQLQTHAGYYTCADKRIEIASKLRYVPMGYFNDNSVGKIIAATTTTIDAMSNIATRVVMMVTKGILTTIAIIIMMMIFDYRIGLIVLASFIIYLLIVHFANKFNKKVSHEKVDASEKEIEEVTEYLGGLSEVKTYRMYSSSNKKLSAAIDNSNKYNFKLETRAVPGMLFESLFVKLIGLSIIVIALAFYFNGSLNLVETTVMCISSFMLFAQLELSGSYSTLLNTLDKLMDIVNDVLNVKTIDDSNIDIKPSNFDISVQNVSFSYEKKKIIDNISFDIKSNTKTAIVGPSGGGKTTMCNLIARFYDIDEGKILLDGKNIKEYSVDSLMRNFTFVFQNVYLFNDTIFNNVKYGKEDATDEEVYEAMRKAQIYDFAKSLPDGFDTVIGEGGSRLSGGEKQRVSIARAILKDSPIIILDEATANVDAENENLLIEAFDALCKDKTLIMIAHRLKTVRNADKIIVIKDGKIEEEGTHSELLKHEGLYKKFINERETAVNWKI
jgi:ATP-binding cassette subfamily B protein